jgi:hypothetical protein
VALSLGRLVVFLPPVLGLADLITTVCDRGVVERKLAVEYFMLDIKSLNGIILSASGHDNNRQVLLHR